MLMCACAKAIVRAERLSETRMERKKMEVKLKTEIARDVHDCVRYYELQ